MDKTSFRVELDPVEERKLKFAAAEASKPMTQIVREYIATLPYPVSECLSDFKEDHPLLIRKLRYWAGRRQGLQQKESSSYAIAQVSEYICALVLAQSQEDARRAIARWGGTLSSQEKSALVGFLPSDIYDEEMKGQFRGVGYDWYSVAEGDYTTAAEPVIELYENWVITQSRYEAFILNADEMMIVDVDLRNEEGWMELDPVVTPSRAAALGALKVFCDENPGMGFRVYETACGLRYICTTNKFKADSRESLVVMRSLFCDPRYLVLCQKQATYRARLTPKPWRLVDFEPPCALGDTGWQDEGAVCRFVQTFGNGHLLPEFTAMVERHDRITGTGAAYLDPKLALI